MICCLKCHALFLYMFQFEQHLSRYANQTARHARRNGQHRG